MVQWHPQPSGTLWSEGFKSILVKRTEAAREYRKSLYCKESAPSLGDGGTIHEGEWRRVMRDLRREVFGSGECENGRGGETYRMSETVRMDSGNTIFGKDLTEGSEFNLHRRTMC